LGLSLHVRLLPIRYLEYKGIPPEALLKIREYPLAC
jgi:hypothetical protein